MQPLLVVSESLHRDAAVWGVTITAAEAAANLTDIDVRKTITPIYAAFAHTPVALLDDDVGFSVTKWARGHEWFAVSIHSVVANRLMTPLMQLWRAAGNIRHLNPYHPLTRLENVLWALIFRIAHHEITAEAAYTAFFTDETVKEVLKEAPNPAYNDELCPS